MRGEIADACGLTDSAIRNYELCNRTPGVEQIESIASALGIPPPNFSARCPSSQAGRL